MTEQLCDEDPQPCVRLPAGLLYVPVRPGPVGCAARLFRTPLGGRAAVGFTSERLLAATLGPGQAWIRLAEPALRALAEPLGATTVIVDPQLAAPAVTPPPSGGTWREWDPQAVGVPRLTGVATLVDAGGNVDRLRRSAS